MKRSLWIILGVFLQVFPTGCKKNTIPFSSVPVSALTIVNAVQGSGPFIADPNIADSVSAYFSTTPKIYYTGYQEYSLVSGSIPLVVYNTADTTAPVFKGDLSLQARSVYSLFLSGTDVAHNKADTLLVQDNPPFHDVSDSTTGIRFINLSLGSNPVSINIQGSANGSEVSSLAYRSITGFRNYTTSLTPVQYNFEFRDGNSGELLATLSFYATVFRNFTIVLSGTNDINGNNLTTFSVNNF